MNWNETSWKDSALKHAQSSADEVCGLVCVVKGRNKYFPCRNIANEPSESFCICPDDWIKCEDAGEPVALFHSHIDVPPTPSELDIVSCNYLDLPFYIVNPKTKEWHDFKPVNYQQPLVGVPWVWGKSDCWTTVINWFGNKGLKVKNWFRPEKPEDILTNGMFERVIPLSGFKPLADDEDLLVGDLILMKFTGPDPDHVAIYIGDMHIVHHLGGKLSSRDFYGKLFQDATVRRYRHAQKN